MGRRKYTEKEKKADKYRSAVYAKRARKVALEKKKNKLINKRIDKVLKKFTMDEIFDLFLTNDKNDLKCNSRDELVNKIKKWGVYYE